MTATIEVAKTKPDSYPNHMTKDAFLPYFNDMVKAYILAGPGL